MMRPTSVVCPAALTALALAAIVPRASCFGRSLRDDASGFPVVTFKVDDTLKCAGALVSSNDVLTTAACAEMLTNDGKAKALLDDKTVPVLCHNTNPERALALVRLDGPLCDADNPKAMFTPSLVAPGPADTGSSCLILYPADYDGVKIPVMVAPVNIVECPKEGSKRSIETKGSEKVCATFVTEADAKKVPLFGGLVLTCSQAPARAGAVVGAVVGLLPTRKTAAEPPVLESAVNLDKDKFWELSGTADCSAPKSTPYTCDPPTSPTKAADTTSPTTVPAAPDTSTVTAAPASSTSSPATAGTPAPTVPGTQAPNGSPGLAPPAPAPLLALAAARALTTLRSLLARRLG